MNNELIKFIKELQVQMALGVVSEEYKIKLVKNLKPQTSKGIRLCHFCGEDIQKGEQCFKLRTYLEQINVCMDCSWLSIQSILKIRNKML